MQHSPLYRQLSFNSVLVNSCFPVFYSGCFYSLTQLYTTSTMHFSMGILSLSLVLPALVSSAVIQQRAACNPNDPIIKVLHSPQYEVQAKSYCSSLLHATPSVVIVSTTSIPPYVQKSPPCMALQVF
jgi:hypothetical protein